MALPSSRRDRIRIPREDCMHPNLLPVISAIITVLSLNGVLGKLVSMKDQIPGLAPAESLQGPVPEPLPLPAPGDLPLQPVHGLTPASAPSRALDAFCKADTDGILLTGILVLAAFASSAVALMVELDIVMTLAISLVAVFTLAASGLVLKTRYGRKSWLPVTNPVPSAAAVPAAEPDKTLPVPATECPPPHALPDKPGLTELERYWVVEPFSYVIIQRVGTEGFIYTVYEPPITAMEKTILEETYAHLRDIIVYDTTEADTKNHFEPSFIHEIIRGFDPTIAKDRLSILTYYLKRDLSGYGPLEVLMRDPALEDLSCNGWNLPVFVFHKVYGSLPSSVVFHEGQLNQFVLKLAQKANKQVSLSNPLLDATLPDGARVQITYSDVVSTKGSSFTIRKFRADPMTPIDLIRFGTYSPKTLAFLWLAIEHHKSLLIVGGTASGKTSTMNAVSLFIPQNAKIVSLEDTREIQLPHRNWLPTQTRELNVEGVKGDIDLFSLLKASMRQRPEFIIVGEVRGREAQTLFQAMNTGHATLSTIHAGSVHEAINRLTHDPINVPPVMFQALDLVIVQSIYTFGKRRIRRNTSIHELEVDSHGEIKTVPLFEWNNNTDKFQQAYKKSRILDEIARHRGWSEEDLAREMKKREEFFGWAMMVEKPAIQDLANFIHDVEI